SNPSSATRNTTEALPPSNAVARPPPTTSGNSSTPPPTCAPCTATPAISGTGRYTRPSPTTNTKGATKRTKRDSHTAARSARRTQCRPHPPLAQAADVSRRHEHSRTRGDVTFPDSLYSPTKSPRSLGGEGNRAGPVEHDLSVLHYVPAMG